MDKCVTYPDAETATICIPALRRHHLALQRRILRLVIKTLVGDLGGFDYHHVKDMLWLAFSGATGSVISIPREISVEKTYDSLVLRCGKQPGTVIEPFDYPVNVPGKTSIPELSLSIKIVGPEKVSDEYRKPQREDRFQAALDYDRIQGDLRLRNRRAGDRFRPLGMSGTKKLKDFLIDQKVPRNSRDSVPILTDGSNILWVVGHRLDDRFKVTADTRSQLTVVVIST